MSWNDNLTQGTPAFKLASTDSHTIRAVAGPGSGKSFAIKRRIARLLENGIKPNEILAITFTRTAANDLRREISSLGIPGAEDVHSRTIHSHALKILMQAEVLQKSGRVPRMVIDHEISPALRDIDKTEYGEIKDKKKLLDEYIAAWASLQEDTPGFSKNSVQSDFEEELVEWLSEHGGILVGEVIPITIQFLRNNPAFSEIGKYKTILVDEYQDLNRSEQEFIRLIRGRGDIVVVGDDDQSIYGFKFAHPQGIQEMDKLHGEFEDIEFSECRRCPKHVTRMASKLISKNSNRTLGELVPHSGNQEGKVQIIQWNNYVNEINGITQIIQDELSTGLTPQDVLILAPRRRIGYKLRDKLLAEGLSVKSYFRESAIEKESVKRAYSLLYLLANNSDKISLRYLIGFGSQDYRKNQYVVLNELSNSLSKSCFEVLSMILKGEMEKPKGITTILDEFRKILTDLSDLRNSIIDNPDQGFQNFFIKNSDDETDFYEISQIYKRSLNDVGIEDLQIGVITFEDWFKKVFALLQESIAIPDSPENIDHIRIMSLHSSKGLSAKLVILCGMIDELMPGIPSGISADELNVKIQEQRRLFYVAITRCKSTSDYPGRLIVSSFTSISGIEGARMGLGNRSVGGQLNVSSTRFLNDFGDTSPAPLHGNDLVEQLSEQLITTIS